MERKAIRVLFVVCLGVVGLEVLGSIGSALVGGV